MAHFHPVDFIPIDEFFSRHSFHSKRAISRFTKEAVNIICDHTFQVRTDTLFTLSGKYEQTVGLAMSQSQQTGIGFYHGHLWELDECDQWRQTDCDGGADCLVHQVLQPQVLIQFLCCSHWVTSSPFLAFIGESPGHALYLFNTFNWATVYSDGSFPISRNATASSTVFLCFTAFHSSFSSRSLFFIFVQNTTIFKTDWWGHFPWAIVHLFKLPSNIFSLLVRSFLPFHVRWVHQSPKKFCGESENPLDVLQDSMRDCAYSCPCIWIGGVWSERVVSIALATVLLVLVLSTFGSLSKARFKFSPQILIHQLLYNLLLLWQNFQDRNEAPKEWCLYSKR